MILSLRESPSNISSIETSKTSDILLRSLARISLKPASQTLRLGSGATLAVNQFGIVSGAAWLLDLSEAVGSTIRFTRWNAAGLVGPGIVSTGNYTSSALAPVNLVFPARDRSISVTPLTVIPVITVPLIGAGSHTLLAADFRLDAETAKAWMLRGTRVGTQVLNLVPRSQLNGEVTPADTATAIPVGTTKSFDVKWFGLGAAFDVSSAVVTSFEVTPNPAGCATVTYSSDIQTLTVRGNAAGTARVTLHATLASQGISGDIPLTFTIGGSAPAEVLEASFDVAKMTFKTVGAAAAKTIDIAWKVGTTVRTATTTIVTSPDQAIATADYSATSGKLTVTPVAMGTVTSVTLRGVSGTLSKDVTIQIEVTKDPVADVKAVLKDGAAPTGAVASGDKLIWNQLTTSADKVVLNAGMLKDYTVLEIVKGTMSSCDAVLTSGEVTAKFPYTSAASGSFVAHLKKAGTTGATYDEVMNVTFSKAAQVTPGPTPSGSGGGCNTGYLPFIVLLAAPLFFLRKKD